MPEFLHFTNRRCNRASDQTTISISLCRVLVLGSRWAIWLASECGIHTWPHGLASTSRRDGAMPRRLAMTWLWIGILVSDARFLVLGSWLPGFPNCRAESPSTPSGRGLASVRFPTVPPVVPLLQSINPGCPRSRHPDPSRTTSRVAVQYRSVTSTSASSLACLPTCIPTNDDRHCGHLCPRSQSV
jgi:hypothetical protein